MYLVNVRDEKLGKPVIQGTKTDEDGVQSILQSFTDTSAVRRNGFMARLKTDGANTYEPGLGAIRPFTITVMKVEG